MLSKAVENTPVPILLLTLLTVSVIAAPQGRGGGGAGTVPVPVAATQQTGATGQAATPLLTTGLIVGRVVDAATGAPVAGVTVTLNGGPARASQAQPPAAPAPGRGAVPSQQPRMLTDGEGRFAFRGLTRGTYTIGATKGGYSQGAYGRNRPEGPARSLTLDDNERVGDLVVRIFKFAALTGRITDEAGEPVVGARVVAYRRVLIAGRRRFREASSTQTDDRGIYRLASLVPAEYVVAAPLSAITAPSGPRGSEQNYAMSSLFNSSGGPALGSGGRQLGADGRFVLQSDSTVMTSDAAGKSRGYSTQYYPASRTITGAEILALASGEDRSGIDIQMRYVPVSTISGTLTVPSGSPGNLVLRLIAADAGELSFEPESAATATDANGAFMFACVPSGQYTIQAVRLSREPATFFFFNDGSPASANFNASQLAGAGRGEPQTPADPMLWATVPVTVGDSDVNGVNVAMQEGFTISGRFEFTGSHPKPDGPRLVQIPISVEPADGRENASAQGAPSRAGTDGRFATAPRTPGKYLVRVGGSPANYIVQSIVINGVNATDAPIDLTASISNAVITFTDQISGVSGTVRGVEPGDDPPLVVLFPADSRAWKDYGLNPLRLKSTRSAAGSFAFGSLVAGDYFAVAIPDEYSADYSDPAYLELLSRGAERFTLAAGEKRTVSIDVSKVRPPGAGREPAATDSACAIGCATVAASGSQTPPSSARAPNVPQTGTGSISGTITINDGGSFRPARYARVRVGSPQAGSSSDHTTLTDEAGRYTIRWLPAGDYTVTASKPAFLNSSYGAKRAGGAGTPVHVASGQTAGNIDIAMPKGAVISGVVIDDSGQPAAGVRVQLMMFTRREGERVLGSSAAANPGTQSGVPQTDDRGEYRFYGLRPGKYVVMAQVSAALSGQELRQLSDSEMRAAIAEAAKSPTPQTLIDTLRPLAPASPADLPVAPTMGSAVSYSPIYYPGTVLDTEAVEISAGAGEERNSINLQLRMVPASRVEGRVIGPDGQPAANAQVQLVKFTGTGSSSITLQQRNGQFQTSGVAAGRYLLTAQLNADNGRGAGAAISSPGAAWAQIDLSLNGDDQRDLVLALAPLPSVSGRIVFDGGAAPDMNTVQVSLEAAGTSVPSALRQARPVKPDANGDFIFPTVLPGRYRLYAAGTIRPSDVSSQPIAPTGPPPTSMVGFAAASGWSVASASAAGQEAFISSFEVRNGQSLTDAQVTMTNKPSEVSGRLLDASNKPVPNMTVVLFPVDRALWTTNSSRVNRISRPNTSGTFSFPLAVPGDYYLAVLTELDNNDWQEMDFKEQLVSSAIRVTIAKGEKKIQDMRIGG